MSNQALSLYSFLFAALIATVAILAIQLLRYKKQIKQKDIGLIKFYLDKKFLNNVVSKKLKSNKLEGHYSFLEVLKLTSN